VETELDEEGFREFCMKRKLDEKTIRAHTRVAREFESLLKNKDGDRNLSSATLDDLQSYVGKLMENDMNTWENLLGLLRYARFAGNRQVEIALLELLDGSDVLKNLSETIRQTFGEAIRNEVFEGISLPPLGTQSKNKAKVTKKFMERMETKLGEEKSKEILLTGPDAVPKEEYLTERKMFLASNDIDDFLKKRHEKYIDSLEKHMKERSLYFAQEIDEEVLDYVRNTPTCSNGVRDGDIIYVTKIPYMAKKYLHEKEEKKKRFYYCHCSWVREAILSDLKVSPNFCYCSAAFEKRPWDVIFDQPVEADVVETVLKGDLVCKFAVHIPKEYTESEHRCG
jgi:hypothetical protein